MEGESEDVQGAGESHSQYAAARDQLKEECEQMWQKLQKTQEHLVQKRECVSTGTGDPLPQVYMAKEKMLKAQIEAFSQKLPQALPTVGLQELLEEELKQSISQLTETLSLMKTQEKEMEAEIEREKAYNEEHQQIGNMLQEKLRDLEDTTQQRLNEKSCLKDLEKKELKFATYHKKLMKQMGAFIDEHYPPPDRDTIKQSKRRDSRQKADVTSSTFTEPEYVPLRNILEVLMNKCILTPHDSYMTIEECHWPPYIALLVRCGIAWKHPEDDRRIRLTPYHL